MPGTGIWSAVLLDGWEARTANEARNYVEYCIPLKKKGFILQPKVEKFAAAHSAAKLLTFFSRRVLRYSMATTLQIFFLVPTPMSVTAEVTDMYRRRKQSIELSTFF